MQEDDKLTAVERKSQIVKGQTSKGQNGLTTSPPSPID